MPHLSRLFTLPPPHSSARAHAVLWWAWSIFFAFTAINAVWLWLAGFTFNPDGILAVIAITSICSGIAYFYRKIRPDDNIYIFVHCVLLMHIGVLIFCIFCYLSMTLNFPLVDEQLIAIDRFFGFDWLAYVTWVGERRWLQRIFTLSYSSATLTTSLIPLLLFLMKRAYDVERYVIAFFLAGLITTILSAIWPAVAGYIHYDIIPADLGLKPAAARIHEHDVLGLRDGSLRALSFKLQGLVTFPSFHTTVGLLIIWLARPLKWWLYWPIVVINVVMLFSTPVDGGHYLTDVLGGIAVAFVTIALVNRLLPPKKLK